MAFLTDPSISQQVKLPNLAQVYLQAQALKNGQQEQQQRTLSLAQATQSMKDNQDLRSAYSQSGGDPTAAVAALKTTNPYMAQQESVRVTKAQKDAEEAGLKVQKAKLENTAAQTQGFASLLEGVKDPQSYQSAVQTAQQKGFLSQDDFQHLPQYSPEAVQQLQNAALTHNQQITAQLQQHNAEETARHNTATEATAAATQAETKNYHGVEAKQRQQELGIQGGRLAVERQNSILAKGDPNAAAQLLIDGDATLSELKARGSTPAFIAQTLKIAHNMSGGKYNAQAADAQFQVAKSPSNVAFFGSANSLIDKGGTLDQLEEAAKDIPGGQIPVFNSIADAERVATGSGPVAKYASILLGVADDYSKVMGGGQGSDTSRAQALKLAPTSASPEARAGAVEGIRGSVLSQTRSRIGKNPILGRMYGTELSQSSKQGAPSGMVTVQIPGSPPGQIPQAALDKFRKDHPNAQVTQ